MPEGDTVRRTAERLHLALAGRDLVRAELRWPNLGDQDLAGRRVDEVVSYGKHILMRLAGTESGSRTPVTLHSHLRMEGSWRLHATGSRRWPPVDQVAVRAVLAGPEWTAVGLWLGMLDLLPTAEESGLLGHLGPDLLAPGFVDAEDASGLAEALRRIGRMPERTIGEAMLDQTNLAGIGTFYMAESLFVKGISPWTPVAEVADVRAVLVLACRMLTANLVRAVPTTTGNSRQGEQQWVHARSGKPCRRCGTTIRVSGIGPPTRERTAFFCPSCQSGHMPDLDRPDPAPLGTSARGRPGTGVSEQGRRGRSGYRRR